MNEVFKIVISLSLSGSLLICIILLFKFLFKNYLSKRWQYYIWLIVIAWLILPFTQETNFIKILFQDVNTKIENTYTDFYYKSNVTVQPIYINENDLEKSNQNSTNISETEAYNVNNLISNLWIVWIAVAVILLIRKITIYQSFIKYIQAGSIKNDNINFMEQLGEIVQKNKIKTSVELYNNPLISSPILIGFFRPCIILPDIKLIDCDFQYIIQHELIHYKQCDMFYKWLVQLTICVHWFNPFVYFLANKINCACELSCDEI